MNRKILSEIQKFKLMVNYDPNKVLSEQETIIEAINFFGKTNLFYVVDKDYLNAKHIGYIDDATKKIVLNNKGEKILGDSKSKLTQLMSSNNIVTDNFLEQFVEEQESKRNELNKVLTAVEGADWNRNTEGSGIMNVSNSGLYPIATNIIGPGLSEDREMTYNLISAEVTPYASYTTVRQEGPLVTVELGDKNIGGTNKTFCDNMVKVNLTDKKNEDELKKIVSEISDYITAPDDEQGNTAISKLTNMTIQGQADSARPTWSPGAPCNSTTTELDHNYGGVEKKTKEQTTEEERHKMNKYLAEYRAKNYKNEIVSRVKEKTGKDITITELEPLEYYGKGESYRGPQYRSMIFKSNAPKHTYQDKTKIGKDSRVVDYENLISSGFKPIVIQMIPKGDGEVIPSFDAVLSNNKYYAQNNETLLNNFSDYTSIALPKIKIVWGSNISSLQVETHDGKLYNITMTVGDNCKAYKQISQSSGAAKFFTTSRYPNLESCSIYQKYEQPLTYYDSSDSIQLNGKTYYKLIFFGFMLVPTASGETVHLWPTEDDIKAQPQHKIQGYTEKELNKIKQMAYIN